MASGELVIRLLQIAVSIILARLLGPSVFGVFGICLISLKLVGALGDLGFSTIIIQQENLTQNLINSAVTLSTFFSGILCIACYLSADYIYYLYPFEGLVDALKIFSFLFVFEGISSILRSLFLRELRFSVLAKLQIFSFAVGGGISLLLAFNGMGILSLIFGLYSEICLQTLLLLIMCNFRIRPQIDVVSIKEKMHYALKILMTRAVSFLNSNLGALLVGKFLGEQALGFYTVAYGLIDIPIQRISKNVGIVALTTLSKFQNDMQQFYELFKNINYYLSMLVFALFIGLFIIAQEFVVYFYGDAWQDMVVVLQILCIAGILRSLLVISSTSLVALNKIEMELGISVTQSLLMLVFILPLLQFGITGVCLGVVCAHGLGYLCELHVIASQLKRSWAEILSHLYRSAVPTGVMLLTWGVNLLLFENSVSPLFFMATNIIVCGAAFVLTVSLMDRRIFSQIKYFLVGRA